MVGEFCFFKDGMAFLEIAFLAPAEETLRVIHLLLRRFAERSETVDAAPVKVGILVVKGRGF